MSDLDWNTLDEQLAETADDRSYPVAEGALHHVAMPRRGGEVDWEGFDEATPPAPVKVFEITDEMRAADAAKQAARELQPEHPWAAVKASLSNDNLRTTKRKPATALRQADEQRIVLRPLPRKRGPQSRSDEPRTAATPKRDKPAASGVTIHVHGDLKSMSPATREAIGAMATAAVAHHKTLSGRVPPIPQDQETTMSNVLCKGGCGRVVTGSSLKVGSQYFYACRASGCAPLKAAKAPKPAKKRAAKKMSADRVPNGKDYEKPAPIVLTALAPTSAHETMLMLPVSEATLDRYLRSLRPEAKVAVVSALLRDLPEGDARA